MAYKSQKVLFRGVGGVDFAPARLSLDTYRNCRGLEESGWVLEKSGRGGPWEISRSRVDTTLV